MQALCVPEKQKQERQSVQNDFAFMGALQREDQVKDIKVRKEG